MTGVDWPKLMTQGRCKNIGVPWSEQESHAVHVLGIPAEYVRKGCLTQEKYKKMQADETEKIETTGKVPLSALRKSQLLALALDKGLTATDEATKEILIDLLVSSGHPKSIPKEEVKE